MWHSLGHEHRIPAIESEEGDGMVASFTYIPVIDQSVKHIIVTEILGFGANGIRAAVIACRYLNARE